MVFNDNVLTNRRFQFELWLLSPEMSDGVKELTLRDNEGVYYSPCVEELWGTYNAALDSVVINISEWFDPDCAGQRAVWLDLVEEAVGNAGIKLAY